jgi:hypothetical protein
MFAMVSNVFASVSDVCFMFLICLRTNVTRVASRCFKSRSGVVSPSSPSAVSPRYLLLVFCCLASFSDCGGSAQGAGGGGAPGDGGADASARSLFLCYAGRARIRLRCSVILSSLRLDFR